MNRPPATNRAIVQPGDMGNSSIESHCVITMRTIKLTRGRGFGVR
jgi:hypothetical protein